jgi:hypothetical protein
MFYQIVATVVEETTTGEGISTTITRQVPTFYLNKHTQGIVNEEHAAKIAADVINPTKLDTLKVNVHVVTEF